MPAFCSVVHLREELENACQVFSITFVKCYMTEDQAGPNFTKALLGDYIRSAGNAAVPGQNLQSCTSLTNLSLCEEEPYFFPKSPLGVAPLVWVVRRLWENLSPWLPTPRTAWTCHPSRNACPDLRFPCGLILIFRMSSCTLLL